MTPLSKEPIPVADDGLNMCRGLVNSLPISIILWIIIIAIIIAVKGC